MSKKFDWGKVVRFWAVWIIIGLIVVVCAFVVFAIIDKLGGYFLAGIIGLVIFVGISLSAGYE